MHVCMPHESLPSNLASTPNMGKIYSYNVVLPYMLTRELDHIRVIILDDQARQQMTLHFQLSLEESFVGVLDRPK